MQVKRGQAIGFSACMVPRVKVGTVGNLGWKVSKACYSQCACAQHVHQSFQPPAARPFAEPTLLTFQGDHGVRRRQHVWPPSRCCTHMQTLTDVT